ncbi:hypothetical protein K3G39_11135 [Pontibacter sp. HSC-14F20]|uniref:hypothetical protein n=1 Tax=Pontibacter sp. HSC-14F20 TaxID=2864136 RepID=UPI001C72E0D6|nr:hypothetical protein [Pontibacter sp. HSC-14F20]MBX0333790.1 hypothetical protein [Pontibacter sp. HSC-14F20]
MAMLLSNTLCSTWARDPAIPDTNVDAHTIAPKSHSAILQLYPYEYHMLTDRKVNGFCIRIFGIYQV